MTTLELEREANQLEELVNSAPAAQRASLRPTVERVIATLTAQGKIVPLSLQRIGKSMQDDAFDEMFDNMPI